MRIIQFNLSDYLYTVIAEIIDTVVTTNSQVDITKLLICLVILKKILWNSLLNNTIMTYLKTGKIVENNCIYYI